MAGKLHNQNFKTRDLQQRACSVRREKRDCITINFGEVMEKRRNPRAEIQKVSVDVSDGVGCFPGTVFDISRFGIRIDDLSKRLKWDVKKMTIVVTAQKEHFKMHVRPRWSVQDGLRTSLGAEIMSVPLGWTEFVMNVEPVFHNDVWGEIRL